MKMFKKEHIQFGSRVIEFSLNYSDRKTLGITVTPELEVIVKAPKDASLTQIKGKIRKRAPWILKQWGYFLIFHPKSPPKQFVDGETHLYLGRQYRLKVIKNEAQAIKLKGKFFEVSAPEVSQVKPLLEGWYWEKAKGKFCEYAAPLIAQFHKYGVEPKEIVLRSMPTRWGSCTPKGRIILNPELIKAPKGCIEYVIIHELCHLVHHDHTRKFWELQTKELPSWEKWKERLEQLLA